MMKLLDTGWKIIVAEIAFFAVTTLMIWYFTEPFYFYDKMVDGVNEGPYLSFAQIWFWLGVFYIFASFRYWKVIKSDEIGVRTIFGQPIGTVTSGLPIVPPGIGEIVTYSTLTQQREFPAEPENIWRGDATTGEIMPVGKFPPLRITFGVSLDSTNARSILGPFYTATRSDGTIDFQSVVPDDSLSINRVTAEIPTVGRYKIEDAVAFNKNLGDFSEVNRQIEDEISIVLNTLYPRISVAQAQQNVDWTNAILVEAVKRRIHATAGDPNSWGINLEGVSVKPIIFNHGLNKEISGVAQSAFAAKSTINKAIGDAEATVLNGKATATAAATLEEKVLAARGRGIKAAAKASGIDADELLAAETAQAIGKGDGNVVIGTDGFKDLMGVAKAIAASKKP